MATTISRNPLNIVQPVSLQLYPRLNYVFMTALPSPSENMNQDKIFSIFSALIPYLIFCSILSSLIQ